MVLVIQEMLNRNMDATDDWHTSTPLLCRHDSGYGRYPKLFGLLELSPIRKQSSDAQVEKQIKSFGNPDKVNRRRLNFLSSFKGNNSVGSESDSGIGSSINESDSESSNLTKKTQQIIDENSNFISLVSANGSELYQPSKYICKDHSCKDVSSQCKQNADSSKIFKSYSTSDLFKSVKNSKIDFLYELNIRNCTSIISDILACLSDEDLRRANNVSRRWQDIVSSDKNANNRRILYINNKKNAAQGPDKENKSRTATPVERDHKSAFMSLVNAINDTKQPLTFKPIQGRYDSFIQELKLEGNLQIIMKCPKCRYPARANTEFKYCCTRNLCKHEFCTKCLGPFLDNHKCSVPELNDSVSSIIVGSRKSRKNLRRLKA